MNSQGDFLQSLATTAAEVHFVNLNGLIPHFITGDFAPGEGWAGWTPWRAT